ncbi:glycine zipper 2TM domain-containing protein [uncultured Nevskia sp.]|uniref:glycine zipper 2TM domain-containing protein n=1 Tax=uncultured Nevskia sp. TaxID=228950 RepID=UPI0025F0BC8A|nr:glycine zipper 2TM domain-containing protein [uncultured Nevskia sp.]
MYKKSLLVLALAILTACGPAPQPPADPAAAPTEAAATTPSAAPAKIEDEPAPAPKPKPKPRPAPSPVAEAPAPAPPPVCGDCGVISNVADERVRGEASALGTLGGAAAGGVAGSQFGKKSGKILATIGGAVIGGFAGREVEKSVKAEWVHHVTVSMDAGGTRTVTLPRMDGLAVGSKVRVVGNDLVPN